MSYDLRDYILIVENVIPNKLCDEILAEYKTSSDWKNTTVARGLDRDYRRCDAINTSEAVMVQKNPEVRKYLDEEIFKCAGNAILKYNEKFNNAVIQGDSGYILLRYQSGDFYKQHTDHFLQEPRIVSCSFSLNDDYEGGSFDFFDRQLSYKVPKGAALMFPSNFMYPHEITPVTNGVRYSVITWFI